jgi:hypothetical protein
VLGFRSRVSGARCQVSDVSLPRVILKPPFFGGRRIPAVSLNGQAINVASLPMSSPPPDPWHPAPP